MEPAVKVMLAGGLCQPTGLDVSETRGLRGFETRSKTVLWL